jgi:hypothetical protein
MRRIIADKAEKIGVDPRHPRSINPRADMEAALGY